jgi:hypothetical protein
MPPSDQGQTSEADESLDQRIAALRSSIKRESGPSPSATPPPPGPGRLDCQRAAFLILDLRGAQPSRISSWQPFLRMGHLRWMKLLVTALILPTAVVLAIAVFETRIFYPLPSNGPTRGIVWDGHTFATRNDFARWLRSRGLSYSVWARRHPVRTGLKPSQAAKRAAHRNVAVQRKASAERKAESKNERQKSSGWRVAGLGAAILAAVLGLGLIVVHRRRHPKASGQHRQSLDVAVFGVPQAHEDDALRTARAALELRAGSAPSLRSGSRPAKS